MVTKKPTTKTMSTDTEKTKKTFYESASLFLLMGTVFIIVLIILGITSMKSMRNNGQSSNTITVTGEGEVFAVPDIATISATLQAEESDVTLAQASVSEQAKAIVVALSSLKISNEDIQTSGYSSNPRYEYQGTDGEATRVLVGYEVSQTLTIKVRNILDAGKVLGILGKIDVEYINGPYFEIDEPDMLQAEARSIAIANAEEKAHALAQDLGVRLGKLVSFSEGGNYPVPMYAEVGIMMKAVSDSVEESLPDPEIPTGENQINSSVTITYKIK